MPIDTALFWLVVAGFLVFDNLIFVPSGADLLRFGRDGRLRYDVAPRLTAAGKEIVFLAPLNLFDRGLVTTQCFGDVDACRWRDNCRWLISALPILNALSALGYAYMLIAASLVVATFYVGFTPVLVAFVAAHLAVWILATVVLVSRRHALQLSGYDTLAACAEVLFVPGYLMNVGKRLVYKRRVEISSLGLGIRALKRTRDEDERELGTTRLLERLDILEMVQGHEVNLHSDKPQPDHAEAEATDVPETLHERDEHSMLSPTQMWIQKARSCLTT